MPNQDDEAGRRRSFNRRDPEDVARRLKLGDGIGFLVRVLSARADLIFHRLTDQDRITPRQFGVLLTLHQRGQLTLTELAATIRVDRSTLGEMVRRMGERALVSRSGNEEDRRSAKLAITPLGTETLLGLAQGAAELQDVLLRVLPAEQRASFLRSLKAVADGDSLGDGPCVVSREAT